MTAETATPATTRPVSELARAVRSVDRFTIAVGGIVIAQSALLAVLVGSGWYYQADFSNLVDGRGPLSISYLIQSQGGHLAIGDRLLYWLMYRIMPLDHAAVVVIEVVLEAVTTVLLARLLTLLVGRRRGVLVVLVLYAASPLLIQTVVWMTASVAFVPSQILILLALLAHVRYALTRRLGWAIAAAAYLFAATAFSEQAAIAVLAFPLISIAFLYEGTARQRMRALVQAWPEWAIIAFPIIAFLGYFFGSGNFAVRSTTGLTISQALHVVGVELTATVAPAMIGGPVAWHGSPGNFLLLTAAPIWLQILAVVFVAALIAYTVRRTGPRALVAWAIPLVIIVVGIVVVAVGRYRGLGMIIARQVEHSGYVLIPLALALCLSLWAGSPADITARLAKPQPRRPPRQPATRPRTGLGARLLGTVVVLAVVVTSVISQVRYAQRWAKSPAHRYVDNLDESLGRLGTSAALYDTPVNSTIIPIISPHHYVSDLAELLGRKARFNVSGKLQIVRNDGTIGPAKMLVAARGEQPEGRGCAVIARGLGDWVVPLTNVPHDSEYFLRMSYLQQRASVVRIAIRDSDGVRVVPVGGDHVNLGGTLSSLTLRLPLTTPTAVLIHSGSLATNLCLSNITVGSPFAVK